MLKGAYRKLKCYYYYNKNFLLMRKKIADFEYDHDKMEQCFIDMANLLAHPRSPSARLYFDSLIDQIDFYVIPKKFESPVNLPNHPVTNTINHNKKLKSVNFFINAPIEIHILDSLWTVMLAKLDYDTNVLSNDVYGNTINESVLFGYDGEISFDNRVLFSRYYNKYTAWRNKAFRALEVNYESANDSVLISLDIQSYFYSVRFKYSYLNDCFGDHLLLRQIRPLTFMMKRVYSVYTCRIKPYRKDLSKLRKEEYPLPIGLFSSMFLANLYLKDFDYQVREIEGVKYYGRYVDDILLVVRKSIPAQMKDSQIISDLLVNNGLLVKNKGMYKFVNYKSLFIQSKKIKIVYIDHKESRALIDIYNKTVKDYPSQMGRQPFWGLELPKLDEEIYSIENFKKENKIRDIGFIGVDSFKVGRYFSALPRRYANVNSFSGNIRVEINENLYQIRKFFIGSQTIEYYAHWLNYLYFLVITKSKDRINEFLADTEKSIKTLTFRSLEKTLYNQVGRINKKAKRTLQQHLDICLEIALSIDIGFANNHFKNSCLMANKYVASNMFEHSFVAFPIANYLDFSSDISFCKMNLYEIGECENDISSSFKFAWSPRFIHFYELSLLHFYHYHLHGETYHGGEDFYNKLVEDYCRINHLKFIPFKLKNKSIIANEEYFLEQTDFPNDNNEPPSVVDVVVGSIDINTPNNSSDFDRWTHITIREKESLYDVLNQAYKCFKKRSSKNRGTILLVLPELCYPIYWINDLIKFSQMNQIAIVTGLQYVGDEANRKYNYLATILPFESGDVKYRNAFVSIREKNDYSPIEYIELAKLGFTCKDKKIANYQIFNWRGIHFTPMVCYEFTDVMARAILKGHIDAIAATVCNHDTTYFSNIIDSTARDLHAFVIQANSSRFGDSRVTGPYDRDSKDVFKIKGGENDHAVIGSIQFRKLKDYQKTYYTNREKELEMIEEERKKDNPSFESPPREKPDIKSLPARYKRKQTSIEGMDEND